MFIQSSGSGKLSLMQNPELLAELDSVMCDTEAVKLVMSGAFDEKIKELRDAKKALDDSHSVSVSLSQAEDLRVKAKDILAGVEVKNSAADKRASELNDLEKTLANQAADIARREQSVMSSVREAEQKRREFEEQYLIKDAELSAREKSLQEERTRLDAEAKELASQRSAFNAKLAALRA